MTTALIHWDKVPSLREGEKIAEIAGVLPPPPEALTIPHRRSEYQSLAIAQYQPGCGGRPHYHPAVEGRSGTEEVYMVSEGTAEVRTREHGTDEVTVCTLTEGDSMFIPANTDHCVFNPDHQVTLQMTVTAAPPYTLDCAVDCDPIDDPDDEPLVKPMRVETSTRDTAGPDTAEAVGKEGEAVSGAAGEEDEAEAAGDVLHAHE